MLTGFILTNTEVLGEILKVDNARIIILLDRYRKSCSEFINWHIIDIANYKIENLSNWHYYVSIINYERVALGLDKIGTYNTPLFIIGGGDVIPMPEIKLSLSENICPADILYIHLYLAILFHIFHISASLEYKVQELTEHVNKHNNLIDRMYKIENRVTLLEERR